jgi:hypothetical protein
METNKSVFNYKKIYLKERTDTEESLTAALMKLYNSSEVRGDVHLFARAVGNALEDCVTTVLKDMENKKKDSREKTSTVVSFVDVLVKTLRSTKEFHKNRLGVIF